MSNVLSGLQAGALPLHTRALSVVVGCDPDGKLRARGDVIDLRKNGCVPSVDDVQPAGIIHMMKIGLELDPATLRMDHVDVEQPFVAVEPSKATGHECCRDPVPRLLALEGDRLDDGFTRRLSQAFGGPLGCSHLLTLFQLMASTVPHAMALERARAEAEDAATTPGTRFFRRSIYVDGESLSAGPLGVTIQLTDIHPRPPTPSSRGIERLVRAHEAKVFVEIERTRFRLERLEVRERVRELGDGADTPWTDHDAHFASLVGAPLIPGMAGRVFKLCGDEPDKHILQDALLQLAPGFIQIMAALMDHNFQDVKSAALADEPATPSVSGVGGMPDSCYMWRRNSPYTLARREAMMPRKPR